MGLRPGIIAVGPQLAGQLEHLGIQAANAPVAPLRIVEKQRIALRHRTKGVA
jgi:hypothetical protein